MPITWVISLALWASFTKFPKRRKILSSVLCFLLIILTNSFICNEVFLLWEKPPTPFASVKEYAVGIVLTGFTNDSQALKDRVYLNQAADRIVHSIRLYKEKKIKYILICGAEYDFIGDTNTTKKQTRSSKEVLLFAGVPDSAILIENNSRNTRENALFAKKILANKFPNSKYLVITSAFHIRRAEACFRKVGLNIDTFSVDFVARPRTFHPTILLMPQESVFANWGKIIHELLGYIVYKVIGYI